MPTLDELMSLPGVYGVIEFSCMGELGQMRGEAERDLAELVAQMCAANMAIYRMQATGWTKLTGQQGFLPERGFAFLTLDYVVMGMNGNAICSHDPFRNGGMAGDELSVCGVAEVACFVRNSEVSFNEVFRTLTEI